MMLSSPLMMRSSSDATFRDCDALSRGIEAILKYPVGLQLGW